MAVARIEVYNAAGQLIQSISDRLSRIVGEVQTMAADGSVTNANIGSNSWYTVTPLGPLGILPTLSQSGTTLSWSYDVNPFASYAPKADCLIRYGVY